LLPPDLSIRGVPHPQEKQKSTKKRQVLQKLVELVNILWACEIIVVEVMNDWGNSRQKDEQQVRANAAAYCEEQAAKTLQRNCYHQQMLSLDRRNLEMKCLKNVTFE